jgi:hypothetical protein
VCAYRVARSAWSPPFFIGLNVDQRDTPALCSVLPHFDGRSADDFEQAFDNAVNLVAMQRTDPSSAGSGPRR